MRTAAALLVLAGCLVPAAPAGATPNDPRRIVAVGDSITFGVLADSPDPAERPYPAGLQILLDGQRPGFTVVNRGVGGETTEGGLARLPGVLETEHPGFVLIMEGTNDATFRVDPAVIVGHLREMLRLVKAAAATPILGAIPPNLRPYAPEAQAIIGAVNAQLPGVAAAEGVRFVDTFSPLFDAGLLGSDLLHPNQQGYDVLAAAWLPAVVAAIDEAAPPAAVVARASVAADGSQAVYPPGGGAFRPVVSANGRFIAFRANAANLVPPDTNGQSDVFVHDRATGGLERVSVATGGAEVHGSSGGDVAISADGAVVAFTSDAADLVAGDINGKSDAFVRDRLAGTTERVSLYPTTSQGTGGTAGSAEVAISGDGRVVAFTSDASFSGVPGGVTNVFVRDRTSGVTTRVSIAADGASEPNGASRGPSLSADGTRIVFTSAATNLVASPATTPGRWHVYVRDLATHVTTLVTRVPGNVEADGPSGALITSEPADRPVISADGRVVAFVSTATNLVAGDTHGPADIYVADPWRLPTPAFQRVSVATDGTEPSGVAQASWQPAISEDGRFVAFATRSTDLVPSDSNGARDIFVRDRVAGTTVRVNVARDRREADADSGRPSLSADGRVVVFDSPATDLVPGDTNGDGGTGGSDAFVALLRSFDDVPVDHFAWPWVEALVAAGVTVGCETSPPAFCPDDPVSREEMAVFLLKAHEPPGFQPPPCLAPRFQDVPCSDPFAPWIAELAARGITTGCGGGNYCPDSSVTRGQMAVFLLKADGDTPPTCTTATFSDVACTHPFADWIYRLVKRGITAGCGGDRYCPDDPVTRAQMAVFLVKAFRLPR